MKSNILGIASSEAKKKLNTYIAVTVTVAVLCAVLNLVLCIVRSDSTHTAFLIVNILTDIVAVWFVIFIVATLILPKKKLYSLYSRAVHGDRYDGEISEIESTPTRVYGLNCYAVTGADGRRFFTAESGAIKLEKGLKGTFTLVENIVVAVDYEQK